MRLIPHIRTRRWAWLTATLLIAAAWLVSTWWEFAVKGPGNGQIAFGRGTLTVFWVDNDNGGYVRAHLSVGYHTWNRSWLPASATDNSFHAVFIPVWIPLALSAALTAGAFWRSHMASDTGSCSQCSYDLTGLPSSAPCPECGKA